MSLPILECSPLEVTGKCAFQHALWDGEYPQPIQRSRDPQRALLVEASHRESLESGAVSMATRTCNLGIPSLADLHLIPGQEL